MNARRAFEKLSDVIAAYPDGGSKTVRVLAKKTGVITEKRVNHMFKKQRSLNLTSITMVEGPEEKAEETKAN